MTPPQKPGRSKQDYGTPWEFIHAVERMLGINAFTMDLAASATNAKAQRYLTARNDALAHPWRAHVRRHDWCWLNPEFGVIAPWVEKCATEKPRGLRVATLLPAGVGTNWFAEHVEGQAHVLLLRPRLVFVGETAPYPKDLMLCLYDGPRVGCSTWDWRTA